MAQFMACVILDNAAAEDTSGGHATVEFDNEIIFLDYCHNTSKSADEPQLKSTV